MAYCDVFEETGERKRRRRAIRTNECADGCNYRARERTRCETPRRAEKRRWKRAKEHRFIARKSRVDARQAALTARAHEMRARVWQCGREGRSEHARCEACTFEPGIEIVMTQMLCDAPHKRPAHKTAH
jgi:hypothetical protein